MKTVLVTGGTSFIGEELIKLLLNNSYRVISLSRNLLNKNFNNFYEFKYDLIEETEIPVFDFPIDFICHLAAFIPSNMNNVEDAEKCLIANGIGTLKLLKYAEQNKVKNFIYISGANTYRNISTPVDETSPQYPSKRASYYLTSKLVGEIYVKHFEELGIVNATILRVSSIYGNLIKKDFIVNSIQKLILNQEINIFNPNYQADFVYIKDVVEIIFKSINQNKSGIYNISSGELVSTSELIEIILTRLNDKRHLVKYELNQVNQLGYFSINNQLAIKELGFKPTKIDKGINELINKMINKH